MSYRHNPALDDAFGVSPATWGREPDKPAPLLPPVQRPRHPAEATPIRLPEGYMLESGRIVRETDLDRFRQMLETDKARDAGNASEAAPAPEVGTDSPSGEKARPDANGNDSAPVVLATIPPSAGMLEKPGEDLLYLAGRWWHRCRHCGDSEVVILPATGHQRSPTKEYRPLWSTPRLYPIRHKPGCPYAGQF